MIAATVPVRSEPSPDAAFFKETGTIAYGSDGAPTAAPSTTPVPGDDPRIDSLARNFWNQLASGNVDRSQLIPQFSAALTASLLAQTQRGIRLMGHLRSFTFAGKSDAGNGVTIFTYDLTFASGARHEWLFGIMSDGKIAGTELAR